MTQQEALTRVQEMLPHLADVLRLARPGRTLSASTTAMMMNSSSGITRMAIV